MPPVSDRNMAAPVGVTRGFGQSIVGIPNSERAQQHGAHENAGGKQGQDIQLQGKVHR
jgi:hypothetical protein